MRAIVISFLFGVATGGLGLALSLLWIVQRPEPLMDSTIGENIDEYGHLPWP